LIAGLEPWIYRRLMAASGLSGVAWGLLWSMMAPYLRGLGFSGAGYGALGGASVFASVLAILAAGVLSDRIGANRVAAVGMLTGTLGLLLVASADRLLIVVGFLLDGVAMGFGGTGRQALASRVERDERLHYAFSHLSAAAVLGGAVGSFAGWAPVLASRSRGIPLVDAYRYSIIVAALLTLAGAVLILGVKEIYRASRGRGRLFPRLRGFPGAFYLVLAAEAIIGFGAAMSVHNIDYYFTVKYGVTSGELGTLFGVQQLVMAGLMYGLPGLADRVGGAVRLYLVLTSTSIPLLVGMTLTDSYTLAAALFLARSILMNVANPLFTAFAMILTPVEYRGVATSLLNLSWTLPAGVGRALGGWLLDRSLELPLRLTALLYVAGLGIVYKGSSTLSRGEGR